jgi:hypothetical protein
MGGWERVGSSEQKNNFLVRHSLLKLFSKQYNKQQQQQQTSKLATAHVMYKKRS